MDHLFDGIMMNTVLFNKPFHGLKAVWDLDSFVMLL